MANLDASHQPGPKKLIKTMEYMSENLLNQFRSLEDGYTEADRDQCQQTVKPQQ